MENSKVPTKLSEEKQRQVNKQKRLYIADKSTNGTWVRKRVDVFDFST